MRREVMRIRRNSTIATIMPINVVLGRPDEEGGVVGWGALGDRMVIICWGGMVSRVVVWEMEKFLRS
jgi:hypothetical protein